MDEVFETWWATVADAIADKTGSGIFYEAAKHAARLAWEEAWQVGYSDGKGQ